MCFLQNTVPQTNLNKSLTFWRAHKRTLKLLNQNQHIQIHGNYAEGKLSASVASSHSARNVPYTILFLLYYKVPQFQFPNWLRIKSQGNSLWSCLIIYLFWILQMKTITWRIKMNKTSWRIRMNKPYLYHVLFMHMLYMSNNGFCPAKSYW